MSTTRSSGVAGGGSGSASSAGGAAAEGEGATASASGVSAAGVAAVWGRPSGRRRIDVRPQRIQQHHGRRSPVQRRAVRFRPPQPHGDRCEARTLRARRDPPVMQGRMPRQTSLALTLLRREAPFQRSAARSEWADLPERLGGRLPRRGGGFGDFVREDRGGGVCLRGFGRGILHGEVGGVGGFPSPVRARWGSWSLRW